MSSNRFAKLFADTTVIAGELGTLNPRPVLADSLYSSFSCGKAVCALLLHILANKGFLSLDENVSAFWPAFSSHGKGQVTVRHILEHRSLRLRLGAAAAAAHAL